MLQTYVCPNVALLLSLIGPCRKSDLQWPVVLTAQLVFGSVENCFFDNHWFRQLIFISSTTLLNNQKRISLWLCFDACFTIKCHCIRKCHVFKYRLTLKGKANLTNQMFWQAAYQWLCKRILKGPFVAPDIAAPSHEETRLPRVISLESVRLRTHLKRERNLWGSQIRKKKA